MDALTSFGNTLNLIDSCLQSFEKNYLQQTAMLRNKTELFFKKIPVTITEHQPNRYKKKRQTLLTYIEDKWYTHNIRSKTPQLKRKILIKKAKKMTSSKG